MTSNLNRSSSGMNHFLSTFSKNWSRQPNTQQHSKSDKNIRSNKLFKKVRNEFDKPFINEEED